MKLYCHFFLLFLCLSSCQPGTPSADKDPSLLDWSGTLQAAKGTTVQMMMWQGDPLINRYMRDYAAPELKRLYQIELRLLPGQGTQVVKTLMTEQEAGKERSDIDLCWINGETFYQLRQIQALYGPFTDRLPNAKDIDFSNPFIRYDFQQEVKGMECPWGNVQLAMIYDTLRTPSPPRDMAALEAYVRAHPGKFTFPTEFTGMTLLKSWLIALAGGGEALKGPFDEKKYDRYASQLWEYLNRIKPYFWRRGETFPESLAALHQMFANGEVDFSMSNNDAEVDNKVLQHVFPASARAYVWDSGTIQNSHFLGISARSGNKAGAMVVCNFLISKEAQLKKMNPLVWGDGTVLAVDRLSPDWKKRFEELPERRFAPRRKDIQPRALMELSPEYMIHLYDDFRKKVLE